MLDNLDEGSYTLDGVPIKDLNETKAANYRNKFLGFVSLIYGTIELSQTYFCGISVINNTLIYVFVTSIP